MANPRGDFDAHQQRLWHGSMAEQKKSAKPYVEPEKFAYGILWLTLGETLTSVSGVCGVAV